MTMSASQKVSVDTEADAGYLHLSYAGELPAIRVGRSYRVQERAVHDYLATVSSDLEAHG